MSRFAQRLEMGQEREADAFALALLMPEAWLRKDIQELAPLSLADDQWMKTLAKKYNVSLVMLMVRLANLDLL